MGRRESQQRVQKLAERASQRSTDATRHKVFISYHVGDESEVNTFLDEFGDQFIGTAIGVTEEDDFVNSGDTEYIMNQIRERYLGDTTVTLVLMGRCTWARRYIDWEIYSSLRKYKEYPISGLLAITLPSVANGPKKLPARVDDNVDDSKGYARWWKYPETKSGLRSMIEEAFEARKSKSDLIDNTRERRTNNSEC